MTSKVPGPSVKAMSEGRRGEDGLGREVFHTVFKWYLVPL